MSEVSEETKELNTNNEKLEKQVIDLRLLAYSIIAIAIVALFFLLFKIWKDPNDRSPINYGLKNLVAKHYWEKGVVEVSWLVHRSNLINDIKGVKSVKLFVKANVSNKSENQYLSVSSITLELLSKSGLTLSSHSKNLYWKNGYWKYNRYDPADNRIEPGKYKELTFNYWVPVKIYEEIKSLSARLEYSLSE